MMAEGLPLEYIGNMHFNDGYRDGRDRIGQRNRGVRVSARIQDDPLGAVAGYVQPVQ